jgi:hypothetical protein
MLNSPYKPPDISDEMLIVFENDFQVFAPNFIGTKLKIIPTTKTILIITDKRIAVFLLNFFIDNIPYFIIAVIITQTSHKGQSIIKNI